MNSVATAVVPTPLALAADWLTLLGISLLSGLFAFRLFVWNPVLADVDLETAEEAADRAQARLALQMGMIGLLIVAVALALTLIDESLLRRDLQLDSPLAWLQTATGISWLLRALLTAVLHFHLTLFADDGDGRYALRGWPWWSGLALTIGLAGTTAVAPLYAANQSALTSWIHTTAALVWLGGLLFLALALWQNRHLPDSSRAWLALSLLLQTIPLSAISLGILLLSGLHLATRHIPDWTALTQSPYGVALLLKLLLVLFIFTTAAVHLLILKPRLHAAYHHEQYNSAHSLTARLRQQLLIEAGLALAVLLISVALTYLSPGAALGIRPFAALTPFITRTGSAVAGGLLLGFGLLWAWITPRAARAHWHLIPLFSVSAILVWTGARQLIAFFDKL